MILNAEKYRQIMNREIQREKTRQRVANWRSKKKTEDWRAPMPSSEQERTAIQNGEVMTYSDKLREPKVAEKEARNHGAG